MNFILPSSSINIYKYDQCFPTAKEICQRCMVKMWKTIDCGLFVVCVAPAVFRLNWTCHQLVSGVVYDCFFPDKKEKVLLNIELGLVRIGVNFCWDLSRWKKNKFVLEHAEQKFTLGKIELEYRWTPVSQASEFSKEALPSQLRVHTLARKMDVHKCCLSAIAYPKLGT